MTFKFLNLNTVNLLQQALTGSFSNLNEVNLLSVGVAAAESLQIQQTCLIIM